MNYLGLDDITLIAAAVLRIDHEVLLRTSRVSRADSAVHARAAPFGGVEFQPSASAALHENIWEEG